ncbi:MAG: nucleotidyltransferase domain-containing protein [Actinomycetota bacterium]
MHDPEEGLDADGFVVTGARADRIPTAYRPLVAACVDRLMGDPTLGVSSLYLYGSVSTGRAVPGRSDLDLIVVGEGAPTPRVADVVRPLADDRLVREIGVSTMSWEVVVADDERGRIERCFLTAYAVHLAGEEVPPTRCRGGRALVRGFAGELLERLPRLAAGRLDGADPTGLARRLLMTTAMHLTVERGEWSTDRARAVELLRLASTESTESVPSAPSAVSAAAALFDCVDSRGSRFGARPSMADIAELAGWLAESWREAEDATGSSPT